MSKRMPWPIKIMQNSVSQTRAVKYRDGYLLGLIYQNPFLKIVSRILFTIQEYIYIKRDSFNIMEASIL